MIGINYAPDAALPSGVRRGGDRPIADAVSTSTWVVWVGHGSPGAWDASEGGNPLNTGHVVTYSNTTLPVVFAIGCDTGAFINHPPVQGPYRDVDGSRHLFGWEGDDAQPKHVWDYGDNLGEGPHVNDWYAFVDPITSARIPVHIRVPPPNGYDFPDHRDFGFASAWLFNPDGGAIVYFGETTVAPNEWGTDLCSFCLLEYGAYSVLGDMWLYGQQEYWKRCKDTKDRIGAARLYLTYMTMFGDPSLRLR